MLRTQHKFRPGPRRGLVPAAVIAVFLAGANLYSQTSGAGTITGTITDATGAVVPSAAVAVKSTATDTERMLATNEAGIYVAQFLQPGGYEITVTKAGSTNWSVPG